MSRLGPRTAAVLLALFVPLAVTPLAIVDELWIGPAMFGAGLGDDAIFVGLGLGVFIGGAIPIVLLALAPAVDRGARRSAAAAAALAAVTAVLTAGPLHELSPTSWVPGGRVFLVGWAVLTVVALIGVARGVEREKAAEHVETEVKAVTYQGLLVEEAESGWRARFVVDI